MGRLSRDRARQGASCKRVHHAEESCNRRQALVQEEAGTRHGKRSVLHLGCKQQPQHAATATQPQQVATALTGGGAGAEGGPVPVVVLGVQQEVRAHNRHAHLCAGPVIGRGAGVGWRGRGWVAGQGLGGGAGVGWRGSARGAQGQVQVCQATRVGRGSCPRQAVGRAGAAGAARQSRRSGRSAP